MVEPLETVAVGMRVWDHEAMAALRREDINRLPIEERLRLIEDIWESIRETPEGPALTDAQRKELDRSLRAFEADPTAVRDLDEILASLHRRA